MKRQVVSHGQHFLRSPALIAELVGHSNLRRNDTVVDLGAGSGAITAVLARRVAHVVAIENEPAALAKLHQNQGGNARVEILAGDMLEVSLPSTPYKVFANIPFRLSSRVVRRLTSELIPPRAIYLIVQRQFARKLVLSSGHFHGALAAMIGPWWVARIRRPLRKTDFTPPPAVDTVLLELKPREQPLLASTDRQEYWAYIERCFAEPIYYKKSGGDPSKKPSTLTIEQWVALYRSQP